MLPPPNGATPPGAAAGPTRNDAPKRRPLRAALLGVILLAALAAAATLPGMWRETERREAFLPQLEAQSARDPDNGPLLVVVGARRMEAGENDGAAAALRAALADGESGDAIWEALAASVAASGDRARALGDLRLGLKTLPDSLSLQNALARARAEDPQAPPPVLAQAIGPDGAAPLLARYAVGSRLNGLALWWGRLHPDAGGTATRSALALERPGDAQTQRLWGEALLQNRRLAEAGPALGLALSLSPSSPATNLDIADYLIRAGRPGDALLQYVATLKLRPDWIPALMGLGELALKAERPPLAGPAFERATIIAPRNADAWVGLGRAYMDSGSGDKGKSLAAFAEAARLAPDRTDFLPDYANALRLNDRWDEAEAVLRRRLAAVPTDSFCHFLLGLTLSDNNPTPTRDAEAEAETREALRLAPDTPKASVQLAGMLLRRGQAREALPFLTKALAAEPYNEKTTKILARAYQQSGQTQLAAQLGARADALTRDQQQLLVLQVKVGASAPDATLLKQLAALYRRVGSVDKAEREEAMVRLLKSDPKQAAAQIRSFGALYRSVLPIAPAAPPK